MDYKVANNLVNLGALVSEPMVLELLRRRFNDDIIYTSVSDVLVAINPLKPMEIYSQKAMNQYKNGAEDVLPPHIFEISARAFAALSSERKDQSILISGESGAGKTETTKLLLQYIATTAGGTNGLEEQLLLANPILEAFGNAQTVRNNNSSRFGKFIEIKIAPGSGGVCGARILNYLLEKSRVTIIDDKEVWVVWADTLWLIHCSATSTSSTSSSPGQMKAFGHC